MAIKDPKTVDSTKSKISVQNKAKLGEAGNVNGPSLTSAPSGPGAGKVAQNGLAGTVRIDSSAPTAVPHNGAKRTEG